MKPVIPIFYACDEAYAPCLGVSLASMLSGASPDYFYRIHILHPGFTPRTHERLAALAVANSEICFENMQRTLSHLREKLRLRDYYSAATYYRLFIAELFPQYNRVLYIDADTVIPGDISRLYQTALGGCMLGAVQEDVMSMEPVFGQYAEQVVGVPRERYFNAGVLVMELEAFRRRRIEARFTELLGHVGYDVAQDQDYLNALCRDSVCLLGWEWNKSPFDGVSGAMDGPSLVHYKLHYKPWHYTGVPYEGLFWQYAAASGFEKELRQARRSFSLGDRLKDAAAYERLKHMAEEMVKAEREKGLLHGGSVWA